MDLKKIYLKKVVPELIKKFNYQNKMAVPRVEKIVVNSGLSRGRTEKNSKYVDMVGQTIAKITGQQPVKNLAKKSIAGFKIREGIPVGVSTILRGSKMYDFMDKLINIALPRIRDFRGLKIQSIDQQGNLSIGLKEQVVFPEINPENLEATHGLQVVITTTTQSKEKALELFKLLGFPFRKE